MKKTVRTIALFIFASDLDVFYPFYTAARSFFFSGAD